MTEIDARLLLPAIVSILTSAFVSILVSRMATRHRAEVEYEFEQRKKLQELTGGHYRRLVSSADRLNNRLWNLYSNESKGWLCVNCMHGCREYYFNSTVYRFMCFFSHIREIELEAVGLDFRVAHHSDNLFLNYVSVFDRIMVDSDLFDGLAYDNSKQIDHFFGDNFRSYCDMCISGDSMRSPQSFVDGPLFDPAFGPVLKFFDGLCKSEPRLRWSRIVSLHLLLMAFLNDFGSKRHVSEKKQFVEVAKCSNAYPCLCNLLEWIPRHDLKKAKGATLVRHAIKKVVKNCPKTVAAIS